LYIWEVGVRAKPILHLGVFWPKIDLTMANEKTSDGGLEGLKGLRVMVVDDNKTIRKTAELMLKAAGCEVVLAEDGFEALAKVADHHPQVIFVDIMMPRLDGYQTTALIKRNRQFSSTLIVMLTSKDGIFDRARGRIVGCEEYLTKPFTKDDLLGAIKRHIVGAEQLTPMGRG